MYNWAELKWWWRNPYTQHMLLQYFEPTGLVTQLPDAYNYKPYWCAVVVGLCCARLKASQQPCHPQSRFDGHLGSGAWLCQSCCALRSGHGCTRTDPNLASSCPTLTSTNPHPSIRRLVTALAPTVPEKLYAAAERGSSPEHNGSNCCTWTS